MSYVMGLEEFTSAVRELLSIARREWVEDRLTVSARENTLVIVYQTWAEEDSERIKPYVMKAFNKMKEKWPHIAKIVDNGEWVELQLALV